MGDRCLCCGEAMDTIGICLACVLADCPPEFDAACARTGRTFAHEDVAPPAERETRDEVATALTATAPERGGR